MYFKCSSPLAETPIQKTCLQSVHKSKTRWSALVNRTNITKTIDVISRAQMVWKTIVDISKTFLLVGDCIEEQEYGRVFTSPPINRLRARKQAWKEKEPTKLNPTNNFRERRTLVWIYQRSYKVSVARLAKWNRHSWQRARPLLRREKS